jgi:hypothetical protein
MYRPHLRMIFRIKETIPMSIYASISTSFIHLRMSLNLICLKSTNLHHSFTWAWASPRHFNNAHQSVFCLHIKSNSSWTRHSNLPLSFKPEWFLCTTTRHYYCLKGNELWLCNDMDQPIQVEDLLHNQIGVNAVLWRSISQFCPSVSILPLRVYVATKSINNIYRLVLITWS